jgi:hypothetical protein
MSSLLNPAIYNDNNDNYENGSNNLISRKKMSHKRTQKRYENLEGFTDKVSKVLETIHNAENEDEEDSHLADFTPPPPPTSVGATRAALTREAMQNIDNSKGENNQKYIPSLGTQPLPRDEDNNYELNNFNANYGDNKSAEEYYKKFVPNYSNSENKNNVQEQGQSGTNRSYYSGPKEKNGYVSGPGQDVLLAKLNYMIHLLEEKQDERTNNVTEEVVLYSFLGIFIIFIVDSFSRVGKYVR